MDIKEIISWTLKHWWWFVISVFVCALFAAARFFTETPVYEVRASLMLRHVSEKGKGPDEMMQAMGFKDNKVTGDEVQVLSSRDLMGRVVDKLNLCTTYSYKRKYKWTEFYNSGFEVVLPDTTYRLVTVDVKIKKDDGKYYVKVKPYQKRREKFVVNDLSAPILTKIGYVKISIPKSAKEGRYRAVFIPRPSTIDMLISQIGIRRLAKESNVIVLSTMTTNPRRMIDAINSLLDYYNQEATLDKNIIAVQTEMFLNDRIAVVEKELNESELAVETYKRTQRIANLSKEADSYQQMLSNYESQITEIDAALKLMDYISEQVERSDSVYSLLPLLSNSGVINSMIQGYNNLIVHRNSLLLTATEQNTIILREEKQLKQKRVEIRDAIVQERQKMMMDRQKLISMKNYYAERMASIPETERLYVEMCREKNTKEDQYVYLITKREENALQLSSEAVPARIVETAQQNSSFASPNINKLGVMAIFFGILFPYLIYFFGIFRKELL